MQWEVTGSDRNSGEDKVVIIEADSEASASRRANRRGVLVASIRPLDPADSVAALAATAAPTPPPTLRPPPLIVAVQPIPAITVVQTTHVQTGPLINGWGIAAAVAGTIALAVSFIPCAGLIAAIAMSVIGIILATVGLIVGYSYHRPVLTAWLGAGMCGASIVVAFVMMSLVGAAATAALQPPPVALAPPVKAPVPAPAAPPAPVIPAGPPDVLKIEFRGITTQGKFQILNYTLTNTTNRSMKSVHGTFTFVDRAGKPVENYKCVCDFDATFEPGVPEKHGGPWQQFPALLAILQNSPGDVVMTWKTTRVEYWDDYYRREALRKPAK